MRTAILPALPEAPLQSLAQASQHNGLEIPKDQPENEMKLPLSVFSLSVFYALLAIAAPHKPSYTFDPQSIIKVEVESRVCKRQGTSGHCKYADITFGAGMVVQATSSAAPAARLVPAFVNKQADNQVTYTFKPTDCKPLPARKADALLGIRYRCKNVSWR